MSTSPTTPPMFWGFGYRPVAAALLAALSFLVILPGCADAQALYGSLTGNVTDSTGAGVPNATVSATNDALGVAKTAQTNSAGSYLIPDLQAGPYTVRISAPSFGATCFAQ